jgi:hypothetical protein
MFLVYRFNNDSSAILKVVGVLAFEIVGNDEFTSRAQPVPFNTIGQKFSTAA